MPSSTSTFSAMRATAQPSGLPPKVLPCSPGFSTPSTSLFESTARDRIEAAGQRLADQGQVGLDALVLLGQQLAGAAEAGLDLVEDQDDVVAGAELARGAQIAGRRDDHARLALDRLDQEGDGVGADGRLQRGGVAERHDA